MCSAVLTLESPVDYRAHSHADYRARDPVDSRSPGSSVHGISHKNIAVGCHFLLQGSSQLRDQTYYALNLKRKKKEFFVPTKSCSLCLACPSDWGFYPHPCLNILTMPQPHQPSLCSSNTSKAFPPRAFFPCSSFCLKCYFQIPYKLLSSHDSYLS